MNLQQILSILAVLAIAVAGCSKPAVEQPPAPPEPVAGAEPVANREESVKREQTVLSQMSAAGTDVSKRHDLTFQMSFSTQDRAEKAATIIRTKTFVVDVKKAPTGTDWVCTAMRTMTPDAAAIEKIVDELRTIAGSFEGDFDGWSARQ